MIRLMLAFFFALLSCCSAPPIERSPVDWPSSPACAGRYSFEVIRQGEAVDLLIGDRERLVVITFEGGVLVELAPPFITGGDPRLEVRDGMACPRGTVEGQACVVARWSSGVCWVVGYRLDSHRSPHAPAWKRLEAWRVSYGHVIKNCEIIDHQGSKQSNES